MMALQSTDEFATLPFNCLNHELPNEGHLVGKGE